MSNPHSNNRQTENMQTNSDPTAAAAPTPTPGAPSTTPVPGPAFVFVPPPLSADQPASEPAASAKDDASAQADAEFQSLLQRSSAEEKLQLARADLKSGRTDRAVEVLARALEDAIAAHGEFSLRCAPLYREYGAALLQHYQAHSSVLGEVIAGDEEKRRKVMGEEEEEDEEEEAAEGGEADGGAEATRSSPSSADADDLTLAYEVLETARVIYARHYAGPGKVEETKAAEEEQKEAQAADAQAAAGGEAAASAPAASSSAVAPAASSQGASDEPASLSQRELGLALSQTYETLASFFLEKEDFPAAYGDYCKALRLAESHLASHDRDLAGLHMDMAVCALFDNQPEKALESYQKAKASLEQNVVEVKKQIAEEEANPTPSEQTTAAPAAASSSSAAAAAAATTPAAQAAAPKSRLQKLQDEMNDCSEIIDELKERIEDITQQLALPASDQALNIIKQQNAASNAAPANPFAPAAASSSSSAANPFALSSAPANPFAFSSSSTPAAAAGAPVAAAAASPAPAAAAAADSSATVTHTLTVKRKAKSAAAPPAPANGQVAPATDAAEGESATKRQKTEA